MTLSKRCALGAVVLLIVSAVGCDVGGQAVARRQSGMGLGFPPAPEPAPPFVSHVVARLGGFASPSRIALADDGILYVSDTQRGQVARMTTDGERLATLSGAARPLGVAVFVPPPEPVMRLCELSLPAQAQAPVRLCHAAQAPRPRVYVGDESDGSVLVFEDLELAGHLGAGAGEVSKPNAIAVTHDGIVHVVDSAAGLVKAYGIDGAYQVSYGAGALQFPTDLVVDETLGAVFVTDFLGERIVAFDLDGNLVGNLDTPLNDRGDPVFSRPVGIGAGPGGRLYVVDNALGAVAALDQAGSLLETFGYQNGQYWTGELALPVDAVSDGERVYVTSSRTGRVHAFAVTP